MAENTIDNILIEIEKIEKMGLDTRTECFMQLQQVKKLKQIVRDDVGNMQRSMYLHTVKNVAELLRYKLPKDVHYIGYLNDMVTPHGKVITWDEHQEKYILETLKK